MDYSWHRKRIPPARERLSKNPHTRELGWLCKHCSVTKQVPLEAQTALPTLTTWQSEQEGHWTLYWILSASWNTCKNVCENTSTSLAIQTPTSAGEYDKPSRQRSAGQGRAQQLPSGHACSPSLGTAGQVTGTGGRASEFTGQLTFQSEVWHGSASGRPVPCAIVAKLSRPLHRDTF